MIYKSTKQIFLSSWQKNSSNSNYNRQTISLFSLWFEEWPENSRGNAYIISTFLDLSKKKKKQEKSLQPNVSIVLLKEIKSQNKIYLNNRQAKVHF